MASLEQFFDNRGLEHIGIQIVSYLDYPDLQQLYKVSDSLKAIVCAKLKKEKHVQMLRLEEWLKSEKETLRSWPEWCAVVTHFSEHRRIPDFFAFVDFFKKCTNSLSWYRLSPLHFAIKEEDFEAVKLLLPSCKDIENTDLHTYNKNALHKAVDRSLEMFKYILDRAEWLGINVNKTIMHDTDDLLYIGEAVSILIMACQARSPKHVEFMLENAEKYKFDFKTPDEICKNSPFAEACKEGSMEIIELLLKHSDKINLNNIDGESESGFVHACKEGHTEVIKKLIEVSDVKGINLNARDGDVETGFFAACFIDEYESIKLLLETHDKIDFNATGSAGYTPFIIACFEGHFEIVESIVEVSEEKNIDLHRKNKFGMNGFLAACYQNQYQVVQYLVDQAESKGIDINAKDEDGSNGLRLAIHLVSTPKSHVAKLLFENAIKKNIDVFAADHEGKTVYDDFINILNENVFKSNGETLPFDAVSLWQIYLLEMEFEGIDESSVIAPMFLLQNKFEITEKYLGWK